MAIVFHVRSYYSMIFFYFSREGIGAHSIPDVEVSSEEYEAMSLQLFIVKERPKIAGASSPPGKPSLIFQLNRAGDVFNGVYIISVHEVFMPCKKISCVFILFYLWELLFFMGSCFDVYERHVLK